MCSLSPDEPTLLIYIGIHFNDIVCRKVKKSGPKSAVCRYFYPVALMNNLAGCIEHFRQKIKLSMLFNFSGHIYVA